MSFILYTSSENFRLFEEIRSEILKGEVTQQVRQLIAVMQDALSNQSLIRELAESEPFFFKSSPIPWQMEYKLACEVLVNESKANHLSYPFEIINYAFYYYLQSSKYQSTFFLMRGRLFPEEIAQLMRNKGVLGKQYVIYKRGQDLYFNQLFSTFEMDSTLSKTIVESVFDNEIKSDGCFIIQNSY